MGYKLLITLFLSIALFAKSSFPDIDQLIEKVKLKRKGLDSSQIKILKNPFIDEKKLKKIVIIEKIKKKEKRKSLHLKLMAIFDKRAKINNRWYLLGQKIGSYRLVYINPYRAYVILKTRKNELRLFLHKKRKRLFKIENGRKRR